MPSITKHRKTGNTGSKTVTPKTVTVTSGKGMRITPDGYGTNHPKVRWKLKGKSSELEVCNRCGEWQEKAMFNRTNHICRQCLRKAHLKSNTPERLEWRKKNLPEYGGTKTKRDKPPRRRRGEGTKKSTVKIQLAKRAGRLDHGTWYFELRRAKYYIEFTDAGRILLTGFISRQDKKTNVWEKADHNPLLVDAVGVYVSPDAQENGFGSATAMGTFASNHHEGRLGNPRYNKSRAMDQIRHGERKEDGTLETLGDILAWYTDETLQAATVLSTLT